jgi:flagellar biosynthesis protein FlhB
MWRVSCIVLVGAMPIVVLGFASVVLVKMVVDRFTTRDPKNLRWTWEKPKDLLSRLFHTHVVLEYIAKIIKTTLKVVAAIAIWLPVLAYSMAYIGGRVYLMVECFMNLAHLPSEVYKEPQWSQYIPHFGSG